MIKKMSSILLLVFVFGGALLLVSVVSATLNTIATATLTITNSDPVASNMAITNSAPIVLTAGTTTTVTATFTVTDNNGCEDIDSYASLKTSAKFFRTDLTSACTPDDANCYLMTCGPKTGCTPGGTDIDATYTCTAAVQFYADATGAGSPNAATDWTASATPEDSAHDGGTVSSAAKEMGTLTALDAAAAINYSSLTLGSNTGTTDQTTAIANKGNRIIDTEVNGYGANSGDTTNAMACTIGTIPIANEKYGLVSAATSYASLTGTLSGTAFQITSFNLSPGLSASKNIYWGMALPSTGVGGTCSGTVVFTPVTH